MTKSHHCLAYVTCPDEDVAQSLAEQMVNRGLAACANILPGMKSVYFWEGQAQVTRETLLILKTSNKIYSQLEDAIVAKHPYDVACVLKLPIEGGNPQYLAWLSKCLNR